MEDNNSNNEQQQEEVIVDQNITQSDDSSEETQLDSTGQQEDTSSKVNTNGSKIGLSEKPKSESSESDDESSPNIDAIVDMALNGSLTDEQRKIIDDAGLGSHFDMIVKGYQAEIAKNDAEIMGIVGDAKAYGELQEWAMSNLSDSEVDAFNRAVLETDDIGIAKLAVEGLQARYLKANGSAPQKIIEAGGTSNQATRPYNNRDEYIREAISNKYRHDPEYAAQVEAKRNLSGF